MSRRSSLNLLPADEPKPAVRILTEAELRRCVDLDLEGLSVIEHAFTWLAERPVDMPPVQHLSIFEGGREPLGDVDIKSAYVPGLDHFAIKIASGFSGNPALGLASGSGLMVVLSAATGHCAAVLLDNGYLTDVRTALAGAVAAKHLAPSTVQVAGVLGTGRQAELQAKALFLVRPFQRLLIYGRTTEHAEDLARRLTESLEDVQVEVAATPREVVEGCQCLITTTASREALVSREWLRPGLHLTAMGSDLPGKQELETAVLQAAALCVWDRRSQCARLGELQHVPETERDRLHSCELGEITSGCLPGRTDEQQITVCDLTGTGVQDTAVAVHALQRAESLGLGQSLRLW